jgi:hypothetical protein
MDGPLDPSPGPVHNPRHRLWTMVSYAAIMRQLLGNTARAKPAPRRFDAVFVTSERDRRAKRPNVMRPVAYFAVQCCPIVENLLTIDQRGRPTVVR